VKGREVFESTALR